MLLHWSPGACSWQTPRRLASWEVMSRCVREPALRGAVHGCEIRDWCLSRSWTPDFQKKSPGAGSHHSCQCPRFWRLPQEPALHCEEEADGRRGGGGDGRGQGLQGQLCADVIRLGGLSRPIVAPAGALLSLGQALQLPVFLPRTRGQAVLQGTACTLQAEPTGQLSPCGSSRV